MKIIFKGLDFFRQSLSAGLRDLFLLVSIEAVSFPNGLVPTEQEISSI